MMVSFFDFCQLFLTYNQFKNNFICIINKYNINLQCGFYALFFFYKMSGQYCLFKLRIGEYVKTEIKSEISPEIIT